MIFHVDIKLTGLLRLAASCNPVSGNSLAHMLRSLFVSGIKGKSVLAAWLVPGAVASDEGLVTCLSSAHFPAQINCIANVEGRKSQPPEAES